jgi:hypothetical protein
MKFTMNRPVSSRFVVLAAFLTGLSAPVAGAPAAGDTYVYQVVNGYNREVLGKVHYQVARAEADGMTVSVTPDSPAVGAARTETYTKEGNRLRGLLESHGVPTEYEFAAAYPAYVLPLESGKRWSTRVGASVPTLAVRRSVRVDGRVLGTERVKVPAGEFDTIKIRRFVYPGDAVAPFSETHITEVDWFAPALGLPVRTERTSEWINTSECGQDGGCDFRGSWEVIELVTPPVRR